jgi:predicted solute-binding protein
MMRMSQELEYIEKIIRDAKSSVKISKEGRKIRIDVDRRTIRIPYDEDVLRRLRVIVEEIKTRIEKEREEALKNFYEMIKKLPRKKRLWRKRS